MEDTLAPEIGIVKPTKTGNVPAADIDFGKVIKNVSAKWTASPWLTLQWLTSAQFASNSNAFENTLTARLQTGSTRSQTTQALKVLDKTIDDALVYVKGYLTEKYSKESAKSYYAAFGIVHVKAAYVFPRDQNSRAASLGLMVDAITANGFEDKEYGTAFWTPIKSQYNALLQAATSIDGKVATKVGSKNLLKKDLKKGLNAIVLAIKANYPDNYKAELRNWGFQKEKY
jgi:hypothetical protein